MCCAMASYDIQAIALPGQRAGSAFALKKVMQHILTFADLTLHYLERLYDYWKEAFGLVAANPKLLAELNWAHFWAIQILLTRLIANYCILAGLARVIGRDKLRKMFRSVAYK